MNAIGVAQPAVAAGLACALISKPPEALLAKVFAYLPLKDPYLLCHVTRGWVPFSREPWTDVIVLDLTAVPCAMVNPILGRCPKVVEVYAANPSILLGKNVPDVQNDEEGEVREFNVDDYNFDKEEQSEHARKEVRMLSLKNVSFEIKSGNGDASTRRELWRLLGEWLQRFPNLTKLTWQNVSLGFEQGVVFPDPENRHESVELPPSTRKLVQQSTDPGDLPMHKIPVDVVEMGSQGVEYFFSRGCSKGIFIWRDFLLLRELCLVDFGFHFNDIAKNIGKISNLEVFIYASRSHLNPESIVHLVTADLPLRILVLSGKDINVAHRYEIQQMLAADAAGGGANAIPVEIPARPLRQGFPPLQIFVGGDFIQYVRFVAPKFGAADFHLIDSPMPELLAKAEVAKIFEGVWAAKVIREGPANGLLPWGSPNETGLFYSQAWPHGFFISPPFP